MSSARVWPKVSVIVVNYNGFSSLGSLLYRCLESLLSTDYPDFEVIFVDNGSNDNSVEYVEKSFSDRRLRILKLERNLMYLGGLEEGARAADERSKYLVFMNNDVVVTSGWLKELVWVMEHDESIGVACPSVLNFDGSLQWTCLFVDRFLYSYGMKSPINKIILASAPCGPVYVIRRSLAMDRSLFDRNLVIFREEEYVGHVVWLKGFKIVYVPTAVVYHQRGPTISKYFKPTFRFHFYKNELYLLFKFGDTPSIVGGLLLRLARLLILAAVCVMRKRKTEYVIEYLRAICWLFKNSKKIVRYRGKNMFYLPSKYSPLRALYPSIGERLVLKYLEKGVKKWRVRRSD
jgi:GT2 family glycosyltransferase